jgi:hypothetical protein
MNEAILKGKNSKYPQKIMYWKYGDPVPEWLSDQAKIKGINGDTGEAILEIRRGTTGGYEIVDSSGSGLLVKTTGQEDYICYSEGYELFSLRPIQFEILYIKK